MATVTSELVTKFSFIGSLLPLTSFNKSMGSSIKIMAGAVAAMGSMAGATLLWADANLQASRSLINLSDRSDISLQKMNDWGFVASATGSDMNTLVGSIDAINASIGDIAISGPGGAFSMLGLTVKKANGDLKNADELLDDIRGRFSDLNLPDKVKESLANQLGIDNTLLNMLNLSTSQFNELVKESRAFGVITKEQQEQIKDYNNSVNKLGSGWERIKNLMAVGLAPQLTSISDGFADLLKNNKDLIVEGLSKGITFIGEMAGALKRLAPILLALAVPFAVFAVATSPIWLTAAAIGAVLIAVDDLLVGMNGGKSVIFDFFDSLGIDLSDTVEAVKTIYETFKLFFDLGWNAITETVGGWITSLQEFINKLDIINNAKAYFEDDPNSGFFDKTIPDAANNIRDFISIRNGTYGDKLAAKQSASVTQNITQNITTNDPVAAGDRSAEMSNKLLGAAETQVNKKVGN